MKKILFLCFLYFTTALPSDAFSAIEAKIRPVNEAKFSQWLDMTLSEAVRDHKIAQSTVDKVKSGIKPIDRVIELDRSQPEFKRTFEQYISRAVSKTRTKKGRAYMKEYSSLLNEIGKKYGVQPRFIVALWGIETNFGKTTGGFSVLSSLATLAFDGRRSAYFKKEFFNALKIIDQGHISHDKMKGSWAGAMGQSQFMPSSFFAYAVDYDGDGHRDIWTSRPDVFASIANYLSKVGWDDSKTWGRRVTVPKGLSRNKYLGLQIEKTLTQWSKIGIKKHNGQALPRVPSLKASLIQPQENYSYLVYKNFNNILKWNRSTSFALAVGLLSDKYK